ncbi:MAG TPA: prepilin-type N-terminal cleavage/methylation domain-containing protein [Candidatus Angelobacter sp.]
MKILRSKQHKQLLGSHGFSLIEAMLAIVILMVGLLALLSLFTTALSSTAHAQEDLIAKQKARELLEAVYSSRDDAGMTWAQIQNSVAGGAFKTGWQPLLRVTPNSNQILGTNVQNVNGVNVFGEGPTLDYVLALDATGKLTVPVELTNYQRQISIVPVLNADGSTNLNLRFISVTVRVLNRNRDYTVAGYISSYR